MRVECSNLGFGLLAATALFSAGCAQNGTSPSEATATGSPPKPATAASPAGALPSPKKPVRTTPIVAPRDAGVIAGWVMYQGTPPKPKVINFGAEKMCGDLNRDKPALYETLVVNPNGTVKGALVTIRGKVPGKYHPPDKPVVVDQIGCIFVPHVVAMMLGQELEFRNSDPVSHNIRGTPKRNLAFNSVFSPKAITKSKIELAEIGIPLKCDIHYWMSAYVHIIEHPFFAVTGDDGSFVISGVPPGKYTLLVWHESLRSHTQPISVAAGEVKEVDITAPW